MSLVMGLAASDTHHQMQAFAARRLGPALQTFALEHATVLGAVSMTDGHSILARIEVENDATKRTWLGAAY